MKDSAHNYKHYCENTALIMTLKNGRELGKQGHIKNAILLAEITPHFLRPLPVLLTFSPCPHFFPPSKHHLLSYLFSYKYYIIL